MRPLDDPLLTAKEICSYLRVRRHWLHTAVKRGNFPEPVRIGPNSIRWPRSQVEAWLQERGMPSSEPDS